MNDCQRSGRTRIFIISRQPIFCDALRLLVDAEPEFHVVGTAVDSVGAVRPVLDCRPDVLLLDVATDSLPGLNALHVLVHACTSARLIVLVQDVEESGIMHMLRCGAHGVLMKDVSTKVLFESIRAVASGQYWAGRETIARLLQDVLAGNAPAQPSPFHLTPRELQILASLADGCANREIAHQCGISEKTVKYHLTNIFEKTGVSSRLELTMFVLHHCLVPPQLCV